MSQTAISSELEQRLQKIGTYTAAPASTISQTLRRPATRQATPTRVSASPKQDTQKDEAAQIREEMAQITLSLSKLGRQYGVHNAEFADLLSKNGSFKLHERFRLGWYTHVWKNQDKADEIEVNAYTRNAESLDTIAQKMDEVVTTAYQRAEEGLAKVLETRTRAINNKRFLERSLIDKLQEGYVSDDEMAEATAEVTKYMTELSFFDETLTMLHAEIEKAKNANDVGAVKALAQKAQETLDKKYDLVDGKVGADGKVSDLRRRVLSVAHSVDTIKGSIVASDVSMAQAEQYVTQFNKLKDMYMDMKTYVMENFKISARLASQGQLADRLADGLITLGSSARAMLDINQRLLEHVEQKIRTIYETPVYSVEDGRQIRSRLLEFESEVLEKDMQYAEAQKSIKGIMEAIRTETGGHYTTH
ncbi:MAG TPA: hypothetical protein VK158_03115 [Acidobacteriota bacterium]|nr:hypothetical protein [Acidobacteriota bacterium]